MIMSKRVAIGSLAGEYDGADLGDQRRAERLKLIAGQLEQEPAKGFPACCVARRMSS
jgi:Transposase DNA-binding